MRVTIKSLQDGKPVEVFPGLYIYLPPKLPEFTDEHPVAMLNDEDGWLIQPSLPHAGFGYTLVDGGFIERAMRAYELFRLDQIHQLGFLEDPDSDMTEHAFASRFNHTRFAHSLDVMAFTGVIVYNNPEYFSGRELEAKTVILAALTHDVLTPAGGDTTKSIDFAAFDEDIWYPEVVKRPEVAAFLKAEGIDLELLFATIRNEGPLGSILDLADKLAYVSRDISNFECSTDVRIMRWGNDSPLRHEITAYAALPNLTSIWDRVRVDEDGVVVKGIKHLGLFLAARACMFRNLYTHPSARTHESLVARTLLSFLYDTGRLTREDLLELNDYTLRLRLVALLEEVYLDQLGFYQSTFKTFLDVKQARMFEADFVSRGIAFIQTEDVGSFFKPSTHFRVQTKKTIKTFAEARPKKAAEIAALGQSVTPVRVYYVYGDQPRFEPKLQAEFMAWRRWKFGAEGRVLTSS